MNLIYFISTYALVIHWQILTIYIFVSSNKSHWLLHREALCSQNIQALFSLVNSGCYFFLHCKIKEAGKGSEVRSGSEVGSSAAMRRAGRSCSPWCIVETTPWPLPSGEGERYNSSWAEVRLQTTAASRLVTSSYRASLWRCNTHKIAANGVDSNLLNGFCIIIFD